MFYTGKQWLASHRCVWDRCVIRWRSSRQQCWWTVQSVVQPLVTNDQSDIWWLTASLYTAHTQTPSTNPQRLTQFTHYTPIQIQRENDNHRSQIVLKFSLHHSTIPPQTLPQSDRPPIALSVGENWWQIAAKWLEIMQWSQWRPTIALSNGTTTADRLWPLRPKWGSQMHHKDKLRNTCCHLANMIKDINKSLAVSPLPHYFGPRYFFNGMKSSKMTPPPPVQQIS